MNVYVIEEQFSVYFNISLNHFCEALVKFQFTINSLLEKLISCNSTAENDFILKYTFCLVPGHY